jgi:MFS family permease
VTDVSVAADVSVDADRSLTGWYRQSTPKVRRVFWTCAVAWGLDSMDGFVYQYLIPAIVAGLGITLAQAGSIASANYFAGAIGGWTGGWLADRYGRARVLQVTILWFSIFSFLSGLRAGLLAAVGAAHPAGLRLRRGMGGGGGAVGANSSPRRIAARRSAPYRAPPDPGSALAALLAGPVAAMFAPTMGWRVAFFIGVAARAAGVLRAP